MSSTQEAQVEQAPKAPSSAPRPPANVPGQPQGNPESQGQPPRARTEGPERVRAATARTRESNGRRLLPGCDQRSWFARFASDVYASLIEHCGGAAMISAPRKMICRTVAFREAKIVLMANRMAVVESEGGEVDQLEIDLFNRLSGSQRRDLEAVGLDPVVREKLPNLESYLRTVGERA